MATKPPRGGIITRRHYNSVETQVKPRIYLTEEDFDLITRDKVLPRSRSLDYATEGRNVTVAQVLNQESQGPERVVIGKETESERRREEEKVRRIEAIHMVMGEEGLWQERW